MLTFEEFKNGMFNRYHEFCVKEWFSAFMYAFDLMCKTMQENAAKGNYVAPEKCRVCLKLAFNDENSNIGYDNNTNMFIFPTSTLPQISEQVLSIVKINIAEKLALYGWHHLLVHSRIDSKSISIWTESISE